jgi:diaminopimelate decarboxylase
MATGTSLSSVFPLGSRLNARGCLEVGGCDAIELAAEFGTPAYVVAEDDLHSRARAFLQSGAEAGHEDLQVVFASKAFPCTAVLELFAGQGMWCDVASGGELHLALNAGFDPERIVMHGNAKSEGELRTALDRRVGLIVVDNFDEIERIALLVSERRGSGDEQAVLVRVTPDVKGDTHEKISTGQADSKFGFAMADAEGAIARLEALPGVELRGLHAHIGSQLLGLEPFRREVEELAKLGGFAVWDLGGGLGVRYTEAQPEPPSIEEYVGALVATAHAHGIGPDKRLLIEPGRALCANSCVTLYTVESVKQNVSRWVAIDGGMSDNMRPMLYGAPYEAHVADRFPVPGQRGGSTPCVLTGKHCESGDVILRDALLENPKPGDVIVTPATGAYGYAMANNYNGVPRPPVIFCSEGDARLVVRRESYEELTARDVR